MVVFLVVFYSVSNCFETLKICSFLMWKWIFCVPTFYFSLDCLIEPLNDSQNAVWLAECLKHTMKFANSSH